jgi:MFS family permease
MASYVARVRAQLSTYPKLLWLLAFISFFNIVGLSFLWPLNAIYIHGVLGRPLTVAGIVLMLNSGAATIGQPVGGLLFDRWGARPVLLLSAFASGALILLPGLFSSWPLYVTVMILYGFSVSIFFPAINGMIARIWPEGGRRGFNFVYVAHNLGVAVGTAVGAILAENSFRMLFIIMALISFAMGIFVIPRLGNHVGPVVVGETVAVQPVEDRPVAWLPIGALFVGFVVLWLVYVQWQSSIANYMHDFHIPLAKYGFLWTLNGLVIFLSQPLVGWVTTRVRTFPRQMLIGVTLYAIAFLMLLTTHQYPIFVAGMVTLTLGEVFLWPAFPAAVAQLSPAHRKGYFQGLIGMGATVGRMIGPLAGGLLYDYSSYSIMIFAMIGLLVVPFTCILLYARTSQNPVVLSQRSA